MPRQTSIAHASRSWQSCAGGVRMAGLRRWCVWGESVGGHPYREVSSIRLAATCASSSLS